MRQTKLVIFDWDGTLVNSIQRIVTSLQSAAAEMGYNKPSDRDVELIIGLGLREAIETVFPHLSEPQNEALQRCYSRHYIASNVEIPLFPGVLETLATIKGRGFKIAVATGKSRQGLDRNFKALNWENYFDTSRCVDETLSKPNPLMLEEICRELDIPPAEALMVGDTSYDLEMAQRFNMPSVGVLYGVHRKEVLQAFQPISLIQDFKALLQLI